MVEEAPGPSSAVCEGAIYKATPWFHDGKLISISLLTPDAFGRVDAAEASINIVDALMDKWSRLKDNDKARGAQDTRSMEDEMNYFCYVKWIDEDEEWAGLCPAFPHLSWLEDTEEKALAGIRQLVREVVADMKVTGEELPTEPCGDVVIVVGDKVYRGERWAAALEELIQNDLVEMDEEEQGKYRVTPAGMGYAEKIRAESG